MQPQVETKVESTVSCCGAIHHTAALVVLVV